MAIIHALHPVEMSNHEWLARECPGITHGWNRPYCCLHCGGVGWFHAVPDNKWDSTKAPGDLYICGANECIHAERLRDRSNMVLALSPLDEAEVNYAETRYHLALQVAAEAHRARMDAFYRARIVKNPSKVTAKKNWREVGF